jgi:hypothetical protein
MKELVHGKAVVRARLAGFLIPLHVFAEIGGVSVSSQSRPITYDECCGEARGNGLRLDPECRFTRRHRIRYDEFVWLRRDERIPGILQIVIGWLLGITSSVLPAAREQSHHRTQRKNLALFCRQEGRKSEGTPPLPMPMPLEAPVTDCGNPYGITELPRETGRNQVLWVLLSVPRCLVDPIIIMKRILI